MIKEKDVHIKSRTDLTSSSREHNYSHLVLLHPTLTLQYTPASIADVIDVFYYKDTKLHDARVVIIMCLKKVIILLRKHTSTTPRTNSYGKHRRVAFALMA